MIKVTLGTTTTRNDFMVEEGTKISSFLSDHGVSLNGDQSINLDGLRLDATAMSKTFADHNITEDCMLVAVVNTKNA